jgi:hypothetical protein
MQIKKYLNHRKADKSGITPIWYDVTANGWQYKLSTGEKILLANWSDEKRVTKKQPGYVNINSRLDNLYNYIDNIGVKHGKSFGKEEFKSLLKEYRADEIVEGVARLDQDTPHLLYPYGRVDQLPIY